jgi:hypothetical protein
MLLVAILGSSSFLFAQAVCTGTAQQSIETLRKLRVPEPAPANSPGNDVPGVEAVKGGAIVAFGKSTACSASARYELDPISQGLKLHKISMAIGRAEAMLFSSTKEESIINATQK